MRCSRHARPCTDVWCRGAGEHVHALAHACARTATAARLSKAVNLRAAILSYLSPGALTSSRKAQQWGQCKHVLAQLQGRRLWTPADDTGPHHGWRLLQTTRRYMA